MAVRICGESATTQIVEPLLADMAHELRHADGWRRVVLQLRWEGAFVATLIRLGGPHWARRDDGAGVRTVAIALSTSALVTCALIGVVLLTLADRGPASSLDAGEWLRATAYLLPQAVIGLPLGLVAAALFNSQRHRPAARESLVVVIGLACCAAVALLWMLPASNQAFRVLIHPGSHPPPPGLREMGIVDLTRQMFPAGVGPFSSSTKIALALHSRLAVLFGPLAFGALALSLSRPFTRMTTALLGATIVVGYLAFFVWPAPLALGEFGGVPPVIAAWLPDLIALTSAGVLRPGSVNRPVPGAVV